MPIQVLPPQLANQIAAGEVVERPASVVKELIENSLDAGATRIDIDIERGGAKLIRLRDNGGGIAQDELALALARHATSKITCLEDLEAIISLGFRGEALASISSVARLTMTSRTAAQQEAWQAYTEGREMSVIVKPAAHPVGTTVEVLDLFYNTPARRKFLRTEKTEFGHIDEVIRRIALARFDVAITLHHNGKLIRQYRSVNGPEQHQRRLGTICGTSFLQHALAVSWQHDDLSIHGWIADPVGVRSVVELQYCYVNGRMMRDRLINHAIRQAYQDQLTENQQPAYVLYLTVDPHQVDVNVHPAKHEVRFHQGRLVHDFIYQAVLSVLQQAGASSLPLASASEDTSLWLPENRLSAGESVFNSSSGPDSYPQKEGSKNTGGSSRRSERVSPRQPLFPPSGSRQQKQHSELYRQLLQPQQEDNDRRQEAQVGCAVEQAIGQSIAAAPGLLEGGGQSFGRVLSVVEHSFAVLEYQEHLALLALPVAERWLRQTQLTPGTEGLRSQPLLIPLQLILSNEGYCACQKHQNMLETLGVQLILEKKRAQVKAVPLPLRHQNLQRLIPEMLEYLARTESATPQMVVTWLVHHLGSEHTQWTQSQAIQLLAEVERLCPHLVQAPPAGLLYAIDLHAVISALQA